jgi:hypothetical protein
VAQDDSGRRYALEVTRALLRSSADLSGMSLLDGFVATFVTTRVASDLKQRRAAGAMTRSPACVSVLLTESSGHHAGDGRQIRHRGSSDCGAVALRAAGL